MTRLPEKILFFLNWWAVHAPKRLYAIGKRAVVLINNNISFTLNLRLLFTPIFGDYTKTGRIIGFIFRLTSVSASLIFLLILWIVSLLLPIIWWILPFFGAFYFKLWIIPLIIFAFLIFFVAKENTPAKKVKEVSENNPEKTFRPTAYHYLMRLRSEAASCIPALLKEPQIKYLLEKAELMNEVVCKTNGNSQFCQITKDFPQALSSVKSINTENLAKTAYNYAKSNQSRYIELEHIFLAVLDNIPEIENILSTVNSKLEYVERTSEWLVSEREAAAKRYFWQEDYQLPLMGGIGKTMTGRVTPILDSYSEDFTKQVKNGRLKKIIGREEEIKKVAEILSSSARNVLLIGEPGSGKTSIVRGLSHKIVGGVQYPALKFKRLVSMDTGSLIAGTKSAGDISDRINRIFDEVKKSGDIIVFIDEIHSLVTASTDSGSEASNIFSLLEKQLQSNIQFIGATNVENYRKYIEPNGAFSRLFERVDIPESPPQDTLEILKFVTKHTENENHISVTYPALLKIIELSEKLIHERVLPDKAIDILNRTASAVTHAHKYLTSEDVAREISHVTHIPVTTITLNESEKLLRIEDELREHVIGQDEAIIQIGAALKRARAGIRNEKKPIASFLFVGTTGVGKTETAKALARVYFDDEKAMIRLDMSEYQQDDSINRLIGTPNGQSKGILTEAVRTKPFALILLDEIEKANPNILLTFLQVLDDGRLTDSSGRVIDFTNTIIIATSNVGTRGIQEISARGGAFDEMSASAMKEIQNRFAPEFLNRFNGIIVYKPLDKDSVTQIANLMLNKVKKMAVEKRINVSFKMELVTELVKQGYNPEWGARPLARVIENTVETYLAMKLLANEIKMGDTIELGLEAINGKSPNQTGQM